MNIITKYDPNTRTDKDHVTYYARKLKELYISVIVSLILISGIVFAANNYKILGNALQRLFTDNQNMLPQINGGSNNIISEQTSSENIFFKESAGKKEELIRDKSEVSIQESEPAGKRLGVCLIFALDVRKKESSEITVRLFKNLQNLKERKVVYLAEKRDAKSVNRQLTGRLSMLGKKYVISISVVDSESGNVLYSKTVACDDENIIENTVKDIAIEIAAKTEIWE